ncbi:hypothetical protein PR048_019480 [Dryococelus australis]|uniref:Uncharacterized protein n=1 Tax=Dryococelus australis TaxID=614101 RepID=A0ABQ9H3K8_9NEOP|nr:hypothetical protein PR048_019480 [Dryococelus australis]
MTLRAQGSPDRAGFQLISDVPAARGGHTPATKAEEHRKKKKKLRRADQRDVPRGGIIVTPLMDAAGLGAAAAPASPAVVASVVYSYVIRDEQVDQKRRIWEGMGRNLCQGPGPAFAWNNFGRPRKTEITIAGPGIQTGSSRMQRQFDHLVAGNTRHDSLVARLWEEGVGGSRLPWRRRGAHPRGAVYRSSVGGVGVWGAGRHCNAQGAPLSPPPSVKLSEVAGFLASPPLPLRTPWQETSSVPQCHSNVIRSIPVRETGRWDQVWVHIDGRLHIVGTRLRVGRSCASEAWKPRCSTFLVVPNRAARLHLPLPRCRRYHITTLWPLRLGRANVSSADQRHFPGLDKRQFCKSLPFSPDGKVTFILVSVAISPPLGIPIRCIQARGDVTARALRSQQSELGSPGGVALGFSHVGIVPDNAPCQRVFSWISHFPRPCIPSLLHFQLVLPSTALNISLVRAAKISPYNRFTNAGSIVASHCDQTTNAQLKSGMFVHKTIESNVQRTSAARPRGILLRPPKPTTFRHPSGVLGDNRVKTNDPNLTIASGARRKLSVKKLWIYYMNLSRDLNGRLPFRTCSLHMDCLRRCFPMVGAVHIENPSPVENATCAGHID